LQALFNAGGAKSARINEQQTKAILWAISPARWKQKLAESKHGDFLDDYAWQVYQQLG